VILAGLLLGAYWVSCAGAADMKQVHFNTEDGGKVVADLYGDGEHAVVLAHGMVFDKESWREQALALEAAGLQVLAIDFRGYGDSRAGSQGNDAKHLDVLAAVRYLRGAGAERVSVVGGSMGGRASAQASIQAKPGEIDRLVLLAHAPVQEPARIQGAALFLVAEGEALADTVRKQHAAKQGEKKLVVLPGSAHAQHLFKTDLADRVLAEIRAWLLAE